MAKQVQTTPTTPVAQSMANKGERKQNLFFSVKTFDGQSGKEIGDRIVDLYHIGTRDWVSNHVWWAMHNGHEVVQNVATDEEVAYYLRDQEKKLQEKFGAPKSQQVEEPAAESLVAA